MPRHFLKRSLRKQALLLAVVTLVLIWGAAFYELRNGQASEIHEAGVRTSMDARMFAEYSRVMFKRIDEVLLDQRRAWSVHKKTFATSVQNAQKSIKDIPFQVLVIDREGLVAFSRLGKSNDRSDLSLHEYFSVHKDATPRQDRLYISKPMFEKMSGRWFIQFSRPIFKNEEFDGVLTISVSSDLFNDFAKSMVTEQSMVLAMVRSTGEILTHYPALTTNELTYISEASYLDSQVGNTGTYRDINAADQQERIYGYYKLSEYGITFVAGQSMSSVLRHFDFSRVDMLLTATAISLLICLLSWTLIRSITDAEELKHHLVQAKQLAESANTAKSQFLVTMSNELRTPLNAVLGMAQLLSRPQVSDDNRIKLAQTIINSGKTLTTLLTDLLDVSQIQINKLVLQPVPCDVGAITHDVAMQFSQNASTQNLKIKACWDGVPGQQYMVDPIRLRQMLSNLIGRVVKFTAHGFVHVVARELQRAGSEVLLEFSVQDCSAGAAKEQQSPLFKRFFQVDSSSAHWSEEADLGMSIVHGLVEQMGGAVGEESQSATGSRFWFRIPAVVVDAMEATVAEATAPPVAQLQASKPLAQPDRNAAELFCQSGTDRYALVVDDSPIVHGVIGAFLNDAGVRPLSLTTGLEAVNAMKTGLRPDFILMDLNMPVMDGLAATRVIRERERTQFIPPTVIIGMTVGGIKINRDDCLQSGMDYVLFKPIDLDALRSLIDKTNEKTMVDSVKGSVQ